MMAYRIDPRAVELIAAIRSGDIIAFVQTLQNVEDVNGLGIEGRTPLMETIIADEYVMFLQLLQRPELDLRVLDSHNKTALVYAIEAKKFSYRLVLQSPLSRRVR